MPHVSNYYLKSSCVAYLAKKITVIIDPGLTYYVIKQYSKPIMLKIILSKFRLCSRIEITVHCYYNYLTILLEYITALLEYLDLISAKCE